MARSFQGLANRVRDLKDDLEEDVPDTVEEGAEATRAQMGVELEQNDSVVTRDLQSSLRVRHYPLGVKDRFQIGPSAAHGKYVENGTGQYSHTDSPMGIFPSPTPHPPVDKIQTWIETKPVSLDFYEDSRSAAWAIAKTIGELGNKPHPFVDPAWDKTKPELVASTRETTRRSVRRF